jgi:hypothetical protein
MLYSRTVVNNSLKKRGKRRRTGLPLYIFLRFPLLLLPALRNFSFDPRSLVCGPSVACLCQFICEHSNWINQRSELLFLIAGMMSCAKDEVTVQLLVSARLKKSL